MRRHSRRAPRDVAQLSYPAMAITLATQTIEGIASALLYSRASRITVGSGPNAVQVSNIGQQRGLDVWFSIRRSLKPKEPNTCDLKIWNLADDTRKRLEQSAHRVGNSRASAPGAITSIIAVKIEAGYENAMSTAFLGELRSAQTVRDGVDFVTEMQTGDGDEATTKARISFSTKDTAIMDAYAVAQKLIQSMGSGEGNLKNFGGILRASDLYGGGVCLKGNPADVLHTLCRSIGVEFTLQNGQCQFTSLGQPIPGAAYDLTSDSGLIGEPSVDTKGVLNCETLLLPGIKPGAQISINALFVDPANGYRVSSMVTTGDTAGESWGHKIEATRILPA
jgi:hypothetical protein